MLLQCNYRMWRARLLVHNARLETGLRGLFLGTQFSCFTGTNPRPFLGPQLSCFTGTKVQILTQNKGLRGLFLFLGRYRVSEQPDEEEGGGAGEDETVAAVATVELRPQPPGGLEGTRRWRLLTYADVC